MSIQKAGLDNFEEVREQALEQRVEAMVEKATTGGAQYRGSFTVDPDAGHDLDANNHECLNCGKTVTPTYHRGHADNDGRLWHCQHCDDVNQTDMKDGAGAQPNYEPRITGHQSRGGRF